MLFLASPAENETFGGRFQYRCGGKSAGNKHAASASKRILSPGGAKRSSGPAIACLAIRFSLRLKLHSTIPNMYNPSLWFRSAAWRLPVGSLLEAGVSEGPGWPCLFAQALTRQDRSQLGVCRQGFWKGCPGGRAAPPRDQDVTFAAAGAKLPCFSLPPENGSRVLGGPVQLLAMSRLCWVPPSEARRLGSCI